MSDTKRFTPAFLALFVTVFYGSCALAAAEPTGTTELRAPAGQVCPRGSFVIGFDEGSNILCSGTCGNRLVDDGEACDDGNAVNGDGCSATCQSESPVAVRHEKEVAAAPPAAQPDSVATAIPQPVVSKIKPWSVVFGASETTVKITGTGFTGETTVLFKGRRYTPSVNQDGTELRVTLETRQLAIGRHAITVSNGPGMETTVKKGLEVF